MGFEYAIKVLRDIRIPELLDAKAFLLKHGKNTIAITAIEEKIKQVEGSIRFLKGEIKDRDRLGLKKDRKGVEYIRMKVADLTPELYEKIKKEIALKRITEEIEEREKREEEEESDE